MSTLLGGKACVDPATHYRECLTRELPVDWWGQANRFGFDLGHSVEPGSGKLLMRFADLSALNPAADYTLAFSGSDADHRYTFQKISIVSAECLSPGAEGDENAVFLVSVADRRHHLARIPIDKAFNVSAADGLTYLTQTLNSGSPWTWQGIVDHLVTALGLSTSQFVLPFTPDSPPENLTYWGSFAWSALNDVLDRTACAVKYDPSADTFSVVRLGVADAAAAAALATLEKTRTWDGYPFDPTRAWRPEKVRVRFNRRPRPTDGSSLYYVKDITLPAATGVIAGTFTQLEDDLTALGATGTPTNSAALATRAQERADDWLRKRQGFGRRLMKTFLDFEPGVPGGVVGSTVGGMAFDDRGGPMRTEIVSRPDSRLEDWRAFRDLPKWFPPDAGTSPPPPPPGVDCEPHGWLTDRDWLIALNKVFTYEVYPGEATGRCEHINEQFTPDSIGAFDGIAQAFYDAGTDKWIGTRLITTDYGCVQIKLDVPGDGSQPPMTGTLTGVMPDGTPILYNLNYECATDDPPSVTLMASSAQLCSGAPVACDSNVCNPAFKIKVYCRCCELVNEDCAACYEESGPEVFHVVANPDFINAYADYNQDWYLTPSDVCEWSITCGAITVTLAVARTTGPDSSIIITFTGGAGGTVVFKKTTGSVCCFDDHTINWFSGTDADNPDTITVKSIFCTRPVITDCSYDGDFVVTAASADNACIDGWSRPLPAVGIAAWAEDNSVNPCGADNGFMLNCVGDGSACPTWSASWNNCNLDLIAVTQSPFSLTYRLTGACPPGGVTTGTTTFVVTKP